MRSHANATRHAEEALWRSVLDAVRSYSRDPNAERWAVLCSYVHCYLLVVRDVPHVPQSDVLAFITGESASNFTVSAPK